MRTTSILFGVVVVSAISSAALAQSVDDLLNDHARLRAELDRCKTLGMASLDDARCRTAHKAEEKRFFGDGGGTYIERPINVFPNHQNIDPQPNSQKRQQPPNVDPPHG